MTDKAKINLQQKELYSLISTNILGLSTITVENKEYISKEELVDAVCTLVSEFGKMEE